MSITIKISKPNQAPKKGECMNNTKKVCIAYLH